MTHTQPQPPPQPQQHSMPCRPRRPFRLLAGLAACCLGLLTINHTQSALFSFNGNSEAGPYSGVFAVDADQFKAAILEGGTSTFLDTALLKLFVNGRETISEGGMAVFKFFSDDLGEEVGLYFEDRSFGVRLFIGSIDCPLGCLTGTCSGLPSGTESGVGNLSIDPDRFVVTSYTQRVVPESFGSMGWVAALGLGSLLRLKARRWTTSASSP